MSRDSKRVEASAPFLILVALIAWLGGNLVFMTHDVQKNLLALEKERMWLTTINGAAGDLHTFMKRLNPEQALSRDEIDVLSQMLSQKSGWQSIQTSAAPLSETESALFLRLQQTANDLMSVLDNTAEIWTAETILPFIQSLASDLLHLERLYLASQESTLSALRQSTSHSVVQLFFVTLMAIFVVLMLENLFAGRIRKHLITLRNALLNLNQDQLNLDTKLALDLQVWESIFYPLPKIAYLFNCFLEKHKDIHQKIRLSAVNCENAAMLIHNCHRELYEGTRVQANAADETSTSILEMTTTLNEIGSSTESLSRSTDESSRSIQEMDRSINNISERSEKLFALIRNSSSSIHDMVHAIGMIRDSLNSLANSVESTSSSSARISRSLKEVEGLAKESAALSQKSTIDTSEEGVTAVRKAIAAMHRIQSNVEQTDSLVGTLRDRSEEIGEILGVIDEVAEQTNLLALNAAIIASQAGEHGKGFSVVADQIKALAEKTVLSIDQIERVISDVQSETKTVSDAMKQNVELVQEGVGLSEKTQSALERILKQSQKASEMSWKIESAAIDQVKSIEHINSEVQNVNQRVRQITTSVEEQDKGGA
ncbi:MAG: methyl-accepting chemotaxis protein, partial [bacterium]|nr:methyl-accepting chemotaxis protein [bacterium]